MFPLFQLFGNIQRKLSASDNRASSINLQNPSLLDPRRTSTRYCQEKYVLIFPWFLLSSDVRRVSSRLSFQDFNHYGKPTIQLDTIRMLAKKKSDIQYPFSFCQWISHLTGIVIPRRTRRRRYFFSSRPGPLRVNNFALPSRRSTSPWGGDARPTLGRARYLQHADFAFTNGPGVQNARVYAEMEFAFCARRQEHGKAWPGRRCNWVNVHPEASLEFKCASPSLPPACTYFFASQSLPELFLATAVYLQFISATCMAGRCFDNALNNVTKKEVELDDVISPKFIQIYILNLLPSQIYKFFS